MLPLGELKLFKRSGAFSCLNGEITLSYKNLPDNPGIYLLVVGEKFFKWVRLTNLFSGVLRITKGDYEMDRLSVRYIAVSERLSQAAKA